ncbi:phospholipase-like protein [Tanacetum coccineum]
MRKAAPCFLLCVTFILTSWLALPLGRVRAFEQETRNLDVEIKQMKELKANHGVTSSQELRRELGSQRNMMGEVDIETLIIEHVLLEEDTHYLSKDESETANQKLINHTGGDKTSTPKPQPEDEELSSGDDLNDWLKTKMERRMCGHDKEGEEDALIAILKSLVGECKADYANKGALPYQLPPKELNPGSFTLPCTIGSLNLYVMSEIGASVNIMPRSIFEHLRLANLKETDMLVVRADMTEKAPLGIVESVLVKINKFLFPSDFMIMDTLGEPNETMILGRPFLATIHAQIDIFKTEITLGFGEDIVSFDMDGNVCHSNIPVKKVYMTNSIQNKEPFYPLKIGEDLFSYESPSCLQFEQHIRFYDDESIDTVDSSDNMQEPEDEHKEVRYGNKTIDNTTCERRYYEWVAQNSEFKDNDSSHEATMYDNSCKYHHEYPHSYFPQKNKNMLKPWEFYSVWGTRIT